MGIPIVIGVTGHRDLREQDIPRLRAAVRGELESLMASSPSSEFVMLNSLAEGADALCAQEALALGMRLACPLPRAADDYRRDFSGPALKAFDELVGQADEVFVAPDAEPAPGPEASAQELLDHGYRQAGIYVATHCHVLLALWDGSPGEAGGCGTAETVGFAFQGGYAGAAPFASEGEGAVIHITTPRRSHGTNLPEMPIEARLIEGRPDGL